MNKSIFIKTKVSYSPTLKFSYNDGGKLKNFIQLKMPLLMVVGGCCSGKSTRSLEIKKYLEEKGKKVQLISDSDCFDDKNFFYESKKK